MCQAFSCIVTRDEKVFYKVGLDSHDLILDKFKIKEMDDEIDKGKLKFARVEITPVKSYLYPEGEWHLQIDERIKPDWWADKHERKAYNALERWKKGVYSSFNLEKARNPLHPFTLSPREITIEDIDNLKRCSSVWDSVWAYVGSLFPNIKKWKYIKTLKVKYPYQCYVNLWERGFMPSFDGKIWRLHAGKNAQIVYELKEG